jgi:hydroxypyruvate isomerase
MDRRMFTQALAAAALGAAAPASSAAMQSATAAEGHAAPFPLSVMLWTVFTDLPLEERLAKIAEAGYRNVELVGEYKSWSQADFVRANAARKQYGIRFDATAALPRAIANPAARAAFLAEWQQALKPMEALGCPAMIVLSGKVVPGLSREAQHKSSVETLKQAAALIENRQIGGQPVRLLLECIDPEEDPECFLTSATEAIEIVKEVNHPQVQFLYDLFHEQIAEGNLIEKLEKHIDVIGLIHVADVPGRHDPGTGEINYSNIYRKLVQLNYTRAVAMEFHPVGDGVTALRAAREMVERAART